MTGNHPRKAGLSFFEKLAIADTDGFTHRREVRYFYCSLAFGLLFCAAFAFVLAGLNSQHLIDLETCWHKLTGPLIH